MGKHAIESVPTRYFAPAGPNSKVTIKLAVLLLGLAALLTGWIFFCSPASASAAENGMAVYAIDLGSDCKGDAVVVESGDDLLLMDVGYAGSYDAIEAVLDQLGAPCIGAESGKHLSLYFSHYHGDHVGGALTESGAYQKILSKYAVSTVYLPADSIFEGKLDGSEYLRRGERMATLAKNKQEDCNVVRLEVGSIFAIGDAQAEVIGPVRVASFTDPGTEPAEEEGGDESGTWDAFVNNCSLATRITCGNVSFLTTGDMHAEGEAALVKQYGSSLKSDFYKLGHHGMNSNSEEFMDCVRPVYSFGINNSYTGLRNKTASDASSKAKVRRTYTSKQTASKYGLCYMIGDEQDGFVAKTDGTTKLCYRYSDQSTPLAGDKTRIVKTVGSYGEDRGGGVYDFYDYYYLSENGKPITGIRKTTIEGVKGYRVFESGGKLFTDAFGIDNGKYCYTGWHTYDNHGIQYVYQGTACLATGLTKINGDTYYFAPDNYYCRALGMAKVGSDYYLFSAQAGKMLTNKWQNYDTKTKRMYFGKDGKRASGFTTINGSIYYFDPATGYGAIGFTKIGAKYYYFRDSGQAYTSTSKWFDEYLFTFDKTGAITNPPTSATPKILTVAPSGKKALQVTWKKKPVSGYVVYMSTSKNGKYTKVATVKKASTVKHIEKSLRGNKTYFFKVRSYKKVLGVTVYSGYSAKKSGKTA